jgi:1-acyl-sn-glycerol-3-phosphate acyltransferase
VKGLSYSPLAWRVFDVAFGPRMRLGVRSICMAGLPATVPDDQPLLLVSNHVSWWDGFLLRRLQVALLPRGSFHVVMLERELKQRPLLRLLGGVGLSPGSATSLRKLLRELAAARRDQADRVVLFFPQGRIWPSHRRPLGFQEGVRLVARSLAPATVLPVGLHLEPGHHPASTAYISVASPLPAGAEGVSPGALEEAVQGELDAILGFLCRHGEAAQERWPRPGEPLPRTPEHFATAQ